MCRAPPSNAVVRPPPGARESAAMNANEVDVWVPPVLTAIEGRWGRIKRRCMGHTRAASFANSQPHGRKSLPILNYLNCLLINIYF
jgi:hypothetical protein